MCIILQDAVAKPSPDTREVNNHTQDVSDVDSQLLQCGVLGRVVFLTGTMESKLFEADPKAPVSAAPYRDLVCAAFSFASQQTPGALPTLPRCLTPSKKSLTQKDKLVRFGH